MRQILAVVSDLHQGSSVAVSPQRVEKLDGGYHQASELQLAMLEYYQKAWADIFNIAGGDEVIVVANGDMVDGDHHDTYELWSHLVNDQVTAALYLLTPIFNRASRGFVMQGTSSHVIDGATAEDWIASELGAHKKRSLPKLELTIQGQRFFFAHHGPSPGNTEHTLGDPIRRELKKQFFRALRYDKRPAHWYIWSHWHRCWHETVTMEYKNEPYRMHGIVTPAWQLHTKYVNRIEKGRSIADIGLIFFVIENGYVELFRILDRRDTTEVVEL